MNGVWEIKAHPFFAGIKWKTIRDLPSPYTPKVAPSNSNNPKVTSNIDTRNFDKFDEETPWDFQPPKSKKRAKPDPHFIGYTFKKDAIDGSKQNLVAALNNLEQIRGSMPR